MDSAKYARGVEKLIAAGELPEDYESSKEYKNTLFELMVKDKVIQPKEDGSGFWIRSGASMASTPEAKEDLLIDRYGEGNVGKVDDRYVVKENGEWHYLDSNALEFNDLADEIGSLFPAAGAMVGTALTRNPVVGAMYGAALGESAKKAVAPLFGVKEKQGVVESASDVATESSLAGVAEPIGELLGKVGGKVLAPFQEYYNKASNRVAEIAKEYGIDVTPSDVVDAPGLQSMENSLLNGTGGGKVSDIKQKQFDQIQRIGVDALEKATKGQSAVDIGAAMQNSLMRGIFEKKEAFNDRYLELLKEIGDEQIPIPQAKAKAAQILGEMDHPILRTFIDKSLKNDLESIATYGKPAPVQVSQKTISDLLTAAVKKQDLPVENDMIDFNTYKTLRTAVGNRGLSSKVSGNTDNGSYKRIRQALNEDYDNVVRNSGLGAQKDVIDGDYAKFKMDTDRPEIRAVVGTDKKQPVDPERVPNLLMPEAKPTTVRKAMEYGVTPEQAEAAVADRIMRNSTTVPKDGQAPYISPDKVAQQLVKNAPIAKQTLSDDTVQTLGDFAYIGKRTGQTNPNVYNASGTGRVVTGLADMISLGTIPAARAAGAKLYTSPTGQKLLTEGLIDKGRKKILPRELGAYSSGFITYTGE